MNTWLLIDVSCLAYASFHALKGNLSHGGKPTEVLFGIFRDIVTLTDRFSTKHIAFCFDGGYDYRSEILPTYKQRRHSKSMTDEEKEGYRKLRSQIYRLRTKYLPRIGFKNVLWQEGCEADDLIGSICKNRTLIESAVIVSSDHDLFQLLDKDRVVMWSPVAKKTITEKEFRKDWNDFPPSRWNEVKAIAGCGTDEVPGIDRVAEKTAVKFLSDRLKPSTKAYQAIVAGKKIRKRNMRLVTLPGEWTEPVELEYDEVKAKDWDFVMKKLGMRSLVGRYV